MSQGVQRLQQPNEYCKIKLLFKMQRGRRYTVKDERRFRKYGLKTKGKSYGKVPKIKIAGLCALLFVHISTMCIQKIYSPKNNENIEYNSEI